MSNYNNTYNRKSADVIKGAVLGALIGERIGANIPYYGCFTGNPHDTLFFMGGLSGAIIAYIMLFSREMRSSMKPPVWYAEYLGIGIGLFIYDLTFGFDPLVDQHFFPATLLLMLVINTADIIAARMAGTPHRWLLQISCNTAVIVAILLEGWAWESLFFFSSFGISILGLPAGIMIGIILRKFLYGFKSQYTSNQPQ